MTDRAPFRLLLTVAAIGLAGVTCAGRDGQDPAGQRRAMAKALDRGDVAAVERLAAGHEREPTGRLFLGEAAVLRGNLVRADSLFTAAGSTPGPVRALALAKGAEAAAARGAWDDAVTRADRLATELERTEPTASDDWLALGIAYQILGSRRPAQFKDALGAYDRAVAADSGAIEGYLRLGQLFLDKYNAPDAKEAFGQAARRDPGNARARLGLGQVALFEGSPETALLLRQAVTEGPGLGAATAALARLDLDAEAFDSALVKADRAVALDSSDLDAWATRASVSLLRDDSAGFRRTEAAVRSRHRAPAPFYAAVAEALARQRQYANAARIARLGVGADSTNPAALSALGQNQLRLGKIDSGRALLEAAFARDPYHVWNKNTLDLLDLLAKYRTVTTGRFTFVADPAEIDLLVLYLAPLLEKAYDSLAARYHYRPPTPVRIEIYRRHADFSVRTVGLAGLGALGVSFGSVLAMDSPSARPVGEFNFGSTAWHELTHAFTLGMTDHRVPRWLSEGLSVLEERRARSGWGANATTAFVAALKSNQLHSVAEMNDGFVRPRHPADVSFAYYQASLLCEYLERAHGFDAVLKLLANYRQGLRTDAAVQAAIGEGTGPIGAKFFEWLKGRFAEPLKSVAGFQDSTMAAGELGTLLASGRRLKAAGQLDQAITTLQRADRMFPEMAEDDSPAWELAQIFHDRGDAAKAVEYVSRVTRYNESHYRANRLEADLRSKLGDKQGALAALERAIFINPYEPALHVETATVAAAAGDRPRAIRERQAVLALDPTDQAGARYELAIAYRDAGDREAARREVLKALEQAPSFEKAQALLLELRTR